MDIFKRLVYFLQLGEPGASPIAMNVEDANELIAASAKGDVVGSLSAYELEEEPEEVDATFGNVVGQESLTRFDEAERKRRRGASWQMPRPNKLKDAPKSNSSDNKQSNRGRGRNRRRGGKGQGGGNKPAGLLKRRAWVLVVAALVIGCGQPPVIAESKDVSLEGGPVTTAFCFIGMFKTRCFVTICC